MPGQCDSTMDDWMPPRRLYLCKSGLGPSNQPVQPGALVIHMLVVLGPHVERHDRVRPLVVQMKKPSQPLSGLPKVHGRLEVRIQFRPLQPRYITFLA